MATSYHPADPSADASARIAPVQMHFPERFQGIFARLQPRLAPLVIEARETLRALPVPREVYPYYSYGVLEHAQPSFMLLPLMFLSIADHVGGIARRHRSYLPWLMLAMEACAILDDTVDHTPYRSGRLSYPGRFGSASAAPFAAFLISTVVEHTATREPRVLPMVTEMFRTLCALETWEIGARYPSLDEITVRHWLECRYAEVTPAVVYGLDSALLLHDVETLPPRVCALFAEIFQDIDDVVNFTEHRERDGENNDLKMGMVTHLLLATVRSEPAIASKVTRMWEECRPAGSGALDDGATRPSAFYEPVAEAIAQHGVPATIAKIISDADQCIDATPLALRSSIEEMVLTFIDRLRRVDSLVPELARHVR